MGGIFEGKLVLFLKGLIEGCVMDGLMPFLFAEVEVTKQI